MILTGMARRAGLVAGAVGLMATALPTVAATAVPTKANGPAPAVAGPVGRPDWCPAVETGNRVDCGSVDRPAVAGRPDLGTVRVSYAVVRHRNAGPATGTVAVNPGGPGEAPIHLASSFAQALRALLADHDVLLVDPRGTGFSERMPCGLSDRDYRFGTREQQREAVARCGRDLGPRAAAYTTAATADDLDAVRERVGAPKLTLYGLSYGTYLMPVYASRHPERVASVVLSGAYPLAFDPLARPSAQAVSSALRRVCDRGAGQGGRGKRPACDGGKAVADLATTASRLRTRPLDVDVTLDSGGSPRRLRFTEGKLANLAYEAASRAVGQDPSAATLLGALPHALDRFVKGDDGPLVRLVRNEYKEATTEDQAPYVAVVCNDYRTPWSPKAPVEERKARYRAALDAARPGSFGAFSPEGFLEGPTDGGDVCLGWPRENTAPQRQPLHPRLPDVPVLVVSGDLDANTPDANGREAARQFRTSRFLSVRNVGHVPELSTTGCVTGLTTRFIRTGRTGDTGCVKALPPISVTPVRP
ncbi:alpha/beta fold hydrolase [Streptomyces mobaraensis]|uniref:alpha/beta fold hydrolase n=1 Tax=Streptomyces mobaraensis TaxID=35621 RepID=UPI0033246F08